MKTDGTLDYEVLTGVSPEDEFKREAIERAAELEILPTLQLKTITETGPLTVGLISEPRKIRSKKLPNGEAWFIDVEWNELRFSMVLPRSLLFSLCAIAKRYVWDTWAGHTVVVTQSTGKIKTPLFEGEAKTYKAIPA